MLKRLLFYVVKELGKPFGYQKTFTEEILNMSGNEDEEEGETVEVIVHFCRSSQ